MYYNQLSDAQAIALLHDPRVQILLVILAIWSLTWKGIALWKASKNESKPWFVAMLILNTVGILEIFYIFKIAKKNFGDIKGALNRLFS